MLMNPKDNRVMMKNFRMKLKERQKLTKAWSKGEDVDFPDKKEWKKRRYYDPNDLDVGSANRTDKRYSKRSQFN